MPGLHVLRHVAVQSAHGRSGVLLQRVKLYPKRSAAVLILAQHQHNCAMKRHVQHTIGTQVSTVRVQNSVVTAHSHDKSIAHHLWVGRWITCFAVVSHNRHQSNSATVVPACGKLVPGQSAHCHVLMALGYVSVQLDALLVQPTRKLKPPSVVLSSDQLQWNHVTMMVCALGVLRGGARVQMPVMVANNIARFSVSLPRVSLQTPSTAQEAFLQMCRSVTCRLANHSTGT